MAPDIKPYSGKDCDPVIFDVFDARVRSHLRQDKSAQPIDQGLTILSHLTGPALASASTFLNYATSGAVLTGRAQADVEAKSIEWTGRYDTPPGSPGGAGSTPGATPIPDSRDGGAIISKFASSLLNFLKSEFTSTSNQVAFARTELAKWTLDPRNPTGSLAELTNLNVCSGATLNQDDLRARILKNLTEESQIYLSNSVRASTGASIADATPAQIVNAISEAVTQDVRLGTRTMRFANDTADSRAGHQPFKPRQPQARDFPSRTAASAVADGPTSGYAPRATRQPREPQRGATPNDRCMRCQEFGHFASACRAPAPVERRGGGSHSQPNGQRPHAQYGGEPARYGGGRGSVAPGGGRGGRGSASSGGHRQSEPRKVFFVATAEDTQGSDGSYGAALSQLEAAANHDSNSGQISAACTVQSERAKALDILSAVTTRSAGAKATGPPPAEVAPATVPSAPSAPQPSAPIAHKSQEPPAATIPSGLPPPEARPIPFIPAAQSIQPPEMRRSQPIGMIGDQRSAIGDQRSAMIPTRTSLAQPPALNPREPHRSTLEPSQLLIRFSVKGITFSVTSDPAAESEIPLIEHSAGPRLSAISTHYNNDYPFPQEEAGFLVLSDLSTVSVRLSPDDLRTVDLVLPDTGSAINLIDRTVLFDLPCDTVIKFRPADLTVIGSTGERSRVKESAELEVTVTCKATGLSATARGLFYVVDSGGQFSLLLGNPMNKALDAVIHSREHFVSFSDSSGSRFTVPTRTFGSSHEPKRDRHVHSIAALSAGATMASDASVNTVMQTARSLAQITHADFDAKSEKEQALLTYDYYCDIIQRSEARRGRTTHGRGRSRSRSPSHREHPHNVGTAKRNPSPERSSSDVAHERGRSPTRRATAGDGRIPSASPSRSSSRGRYRRRTRSPSPVGGTAATDARSPRTVSPVRDPPPPGAANGNTTVAAPQGAAAATEADNPFSGPPAPAPPRRGTSPPRAKHQRLLQHDNLSIVLEGTVYGDYLAQTQGQLSRMSFSRVIGEHISTSDAIKLRNLLAKLPKLSPIFAKSKIEATDTLTSVAVALQPLLTNNGQTPAVFTYAGGSDSPITVQFKHNNNVPYTVASAIISVTVDALSLLTDAAYAISDHAPDNFPISAHAQPYVEHATYLSKDASFMELLYNNIDLIPASARPPRGCPLYQALNFLRAHMDARGKRDSTAYTDPIYIDPVVFTTVLSIAMPHIAWRITTVSDVTGRTDPTVETTGWLANAEHVATIAVLRMPGKTTPPVIIPFTPKDPKPPPGAFYAPRFSGGCFILHSDSEGTQPAPLTQEPADSLTISMGAFSSASATGTTSAPSVTPPMKTTVTSADPATAIKAGTTAQAAATRPAAAIPITTSPVSGSEYPKGSAETSGTPVPKVILIDFTREAVPLALWSTQRHADILAYYSPARTALDSDLFTDIDVRTLFSFTDDTDYHRDLGPILQQATHLVLCGPATPTGAQEAHNILSAFQASSAPTPAPPPIVLLAGTAVGSLTGAAQLPKLNSEFFSFNPVTFPSIIVSAMSTVTPSLELGSLLTAALTSAPGTDAVTHPKQDPALSRVWDTMLSSAFRHGFSDQFGATPAALTLRTGGGKDSPPTLKHEAENTAKFSAFSHALVDAERVAHERLQEELRAKSVMRGPSPEATTQRSQRSAREKSAFRQPTVARTPRKMTARSFFGLISALAFIPFMLVLMPYLTSVQPVYRPSFHHVEGSFVAKIDPAAFSGSAAASLCASARTAGTLPEANINSEDVVAEYWPPDVGLVPASHTTPSKPPDPPPDNGSNVPGHPNFRWKVNTSLHPTVHAAFINMLNENHDCFAFSVSDLGRYKGHNFTIEIDQQAASKAKLFKAQYRNQSYEERRIIATQCEELYKNGLIEPSNQTAYASPTVLPPKKDESGSYTDRRMCGDYREINTATQQDPYVMPTADDTFDHLNGSNIFSKVDLFKGYHQIEIHPDHRCKTAFWGDKQLWQWTVMPFGLRNAGACFQRAMDTTLAGLKFCQCYIDDVLAHKCCSKVSLEATISDQLQHVQDCSVMLRRMRDNGMRAHPGKSEFGFSQIDFLGHTASEHGIAPQQGKVQALLAIPPPSNLSDLRSFMGLANYYRKSVPDFSTIAHPLNCLTKKGVEWRWSAGQQLAFETIKERLSSASFMAAPDFTRPFILQTDWSKIGCGAILAQLDANGVERVVAYASKSNTPAEANYGSYKGEMAAVVWAVSHFRRYLIGRPFVVVTDHQPLKWLMTSGELTGQYARWTLKLQEYNFTIIHRPGTANPNADALSRQPDPSVSYLVTGSGPDDFMPPTDAQSDPFAKSDAEHIRAITDHYSRLTVALSAQVLATDSFGNPDAAHHLNDYSRPARGIIPTSTQVVFTQAAVAALSRSVHESAAWSCAAFQENHESSDIWEDQETLSFIQSGQANPAFSATQNARITKRASRYQWRDGKLFFISANGSLRQVPPPQDRTALIQHVHSQYGHFGVKRTVQLLSHGYWWNDMWSNTANVVRQCESCDRNKAGFNVRPTELNPLPIDGLGHRWHVDLAGPLTKTVRDKNDKDGEEGFTYLFIAVEAFSKWIEVLPMKNKSAHSVTSAFLTSVLARFGACAVVTTDQGREFYGSFLDTLQNLGIHHRETSRSHPQSNGLAERVVQTIKDCIRRSDDANHTKWDRHLPWILMGYRMSVQSSLGFSPYHILYGRAPVIPPAIKEQHSGLLNLDDPSAAAASIIARGMLYQRMMPQAFENLAIAQTKDKARYAETRTGGYIPKYRQFFKDDFVYVRDPAGGTNTLNHSVLPHIYRVAEVRANGILILKGRDSRYFAEHVSNCSPCHLHIPDTSDDPALAPTPSKGRGGGIPCRACNGVDSTQPGNDILLCDHCNDGWHQLCLWPHVLTIPDSHWFCPECVNRGHTNVAVSALAAREHTFRSLSSDAGFSLQDIDLASARGVLHTLQAVMPGSWTQAHATALFHSLPGQPRFLQTRSAHPERVITLPEEYTPLLARINFEGVATIFDPCNGSGSTTRQLAQLFSSSPSPPSSAPTIISSDIDPSVGAQHCGNALDPSFLSRVQDEYGGLDVIITSPWFRMLDLFIPILFRFAQQALFIHVPGHYLTNMPTARRHWFRRHAGFIKIITADMPVGLIGRRCAWLCIFKTAAVKRRMLSLLPGDTTLNTII